MVQLVSKEFFMSNYFKYFILTILLFSLWNCSAPEDGAKEKVVVPEKITFLFVTQPSCPSCDKLEESMELSKPKELLEKYFNVKKVYLGEKLPDGLMEPNGTPTVYFLGSNDEVLVEPMVGEREEQGLMDFLEDALLEFKKTYHVDLVKKMALNKKIDNNSDDAKTH